MRWIERLAAQPEVPMDLDLVCFVNRLVLQQTDTAPLAWYPRLLHATPEQRERWEISGAGYGIHWPELDEDLSVEGLLRGMPAPRKSSLIRA